MLSLVVSSMMRARGYGSSLDGGGVEEKSYRRMPHAEEDFKLRTVHAAQLSCCKAIQKQVTNGLKIRFDSPEIRIQPILEEGHFVTA